MKSREAVDADVGLASSALKHQLSSGTAVGLLGSAGGGSVMRKQNATNEAERTTSTAGLTISRGGRSSDTVQSIKDLQHEDERQPQGVKRVIIV